jgi:amidase
MSETVKLTLFMGEYMHRYYHGRYYAKSQNLKRVLRQSYDDVLAEHDVIVMPTIPFRATEIPAATRLFRCPAAWSTVSPSG